MNTATKLAAVAAVRRSRAEDERRTEERRQRRDKRAANLAMVRRLREQAKWWKTMESTEAIEVEGQHFTWADIISGLVDRQDHLYRPNMYFNVRWDRIDGDPETCCESNFEIMIRTLCGHWDQDAANALWVPLAKAGVIRQWRVCDWDCIVSPAVLPAKLLRGMMARVQENMRHPDGGYPWVSQPTKMNCPMYYRALTVIMAARGIKMKKVN